MTIKSTYTAFLAGLIILIGACTSSDQPEMAGAENTISIPEHIHDLDSLTVYPEDAQTPDTVELVQEMVIESDEETYFDGYLGDLVVDDKDRMYLHVVRPGFNKIYVLNPDGSIVTTIGRPGRGPGEFLGVSEMRIHGDRLYTYDSIQFKISVFSLRDFTLLEDMIVTKEQAANDSELLKLSAKGEFFVKKDSTFLMGFQTGSLQNVFKDTMKLYYHINEEGMVQPGKILELKRHRYYPPADKRSWMPGIMPFENKSIIRFHNNRLYVIWTKDFLIKEYNLQGTYRRAFYRPYTGPPLDIFNIGLNERRLEIAEYNDQLIPDNWPAVHNFEIDEKGRFWVFTITESDSTYKGWVLNPNGKLLARFDWPGERVSRFPMSDPFILIKNGYFYTDEQDTRKGIDRIVKYKINFKSKGK